jgi:hypothetical protein
MYYLAITALKFYYKLNSRGFYRHFLDSFNEEVFTEPIMETKENLVDNDIPVSFTKMSIDGSREYRILNSNHPEVKALYERLESEPSFEEKLKIKKIRLIGQEAISE